MKAKIKPLANRLIRKIYMAQETCDINKLEENFECKLGNCDKCTGLAIEYLYQRWKEKEKERLEKGNDETKTDRRK